MLIAFDVYAGPLTRYYSQNLKNLAELACEQQSISYTKVTPKRWFAPSPQKLASKAVKFRDQVALHVKKNGATIEPWNEDQGQEYFTVRPGWEGYLALLTRAAYLDFEESEPVDLPGYDELLGLPAARRHLQDNVPFTALLFCEIWIPHHEPFVFRHPRPEGRLDLIGTTGALLLALTSISDNVGVDPTEERKKNTDQPAFGSSVAESFEHGLVTFLRTATWADEHRLPMKLDY
jgi:hypothetical protein